MKKILLILAMFFCIAGISYADNISVIEGTWNKRTPKVIKLFEVENGTLKEIASSLLTNENKFYFAFAPIREAFYVIGLDLTMQNKYTFYFKPGDKLNVVIDEGNGYTLAGENTPENKEMAKWHDFVLPIEDKSIYFMGKNSTYVDFFPLLEEKLGELSSYQQGYKSNPVFNEAFKYLQKFDMLHYALQFIGTPRTAHPQGDDFPDYYRNIDISDITSSDKLLEYPYGMNIISRYNLSLAAIKAGSFTEEQKKELRSPLSMLTYLLPQIVDNKIKGETVLLQTNYIKSYDGFLDFESKYGKYLVTDSQKNRLKNIISKVAENNKGQTAIDFRFPDITGKEVALSDFKGKVVYVDVWATWCGPCIKEIPALKKLEEEYHGKDIVFMSVSTDDVKDKQKWLDFIKNRELKGVQLFAGDKKSEDLMKPYKITGIPRFILVGKDGKLVSADAPRPSSSEIKVLLDATLKK